MNIVHKVNQDLIFFGNLIYICPERLLFRPISESLTLNIKNTHQDDLDWDAISRWFNQYMLALSEEEYDEYSYFDFICNNVQELKTLYHDYLSSNNNQENPIEIRNKDFSVAELLHLSDQEPVGSLDYHSFSLVAIGTKSVVTQNNILDIIRDVYKDKHLLIFLLMNPHFLNRIPNKEFDQLFFSLGFKYSDMMCLLENEYFCSRITEYHIAKIISHYLPSMDSYTASLYLDDILTAITNSQTLFDKLQEYHITPILDTASLIDTEQFEASRTLKSKVFSILSDATLDSYLFNTQDNVDRRKLDGYYITLLCCNTYLKDYFSRLNEAKLVYLFESVMGFLDNEWLESFIEHTFNSLQITNLLSDNQILSLIHSIKNQKLVELIIDYISNRYSDADD